MQNINHFVRIDCAWSYNMIGGLKGIVDIDMRLLSDIFSKVGAFLVARHKFHMTGDNHQYNGFIHTLNEHLDSYEVGACYFINYFEGLFRMISASMSQITSPIVGSYPMTNSTGEIEGFVFST